MLKLNLTSTQIASDNNFDTLIYPLFEGTSGATLPEALESLLASGEAKPKPRTTAVTHSGGKRLLGFGVGKADPLTTELARELGASVAAELARLGSEKAVLVTDEGFGSEHLVAFANGAILSGYRFDRFKSDPADPPSLLELSFASAAVSQTQLDEIAVITQAQCAARDLQNTPANELTPTHLAQRARELAGEIEGLSVEVTGREGIIKAGMGAFACVAQGSEQEPALIVLRYTPQERRGPVLGLVGKAVTFDTGGISIKPSPKMEEMKFDMSGGAIVLEGIAAIARLGLPVEVVAVIGATENMPSGNAVKPGDIVTAKNGKTIEVNNTDAEGRLVLADCLTHAVELGAERIVNFATLTGAILIALGSTHAGLFSNDDAWATQIEAAASDTDELVWRLPFHPEYAKSIEGQYGDLSNINFDRKAGSITAAEFLKHFVGETPWAHVDIAGTAWNLGRPYAQKGGSGYGVRLIVELAKTTGA